VDLAQLAAALEVVDHAGVHGFVDDEHPAVVR